MIVGRPTYFKTKYGQRPKLRCETCSGTSARRRKWESTSNLRKTGKSDFKPTNSFFNQPTQTTPHHINTSLSFAWEASNAARTRPVWHFQGSATVSGLRLSLAATILQFQVLQAWFTNFHQPNPNLQPPNLISFHFWKARWQKWKTKKNTQIMKALPVH